MALEDRCSPQSAPSPPGIPHSPHSTTSSISAHSPISTQLALDMSIHSQTSMKHQYEMCLSPQSDSSIVTSIKEETDSIIDPEELDDPQPPPAHHQPSTSISFSITNILSDRFGLEKMKQHTQAATKKHIFRPYEIPRSSPPRSVSPPATERTSAFTRLSQLSAVAAAADYNRFQQLPLSHPSHPHHAAAAAAMMVPNFLNCFNPVAYPRIHEEILNQRKFSTQHKQVEANKMPPLGSLCKTVSQIGQQNSISSPPPTSASSTSSISSTSASPSSRIPASSPQPIPPPSVSRDSGMESSDDTKSESGSTKDENALWPAWVYCTRYSDRPSSGPRYRKPKQPKDKNAPSEEKRPRTAFSSDQLARLKREFNENRYLTERRRQALSEELGLNEAQIKIWFQNKRAKIKKTSGNKNPLALQLMAQGLYNHSTVPLTPEEEELEMRMNGKLV